MSAPESRVEARQITVKNGYSLVDHRMIGCKVRYCRRVRALTRRPRREVEDKHPFSKGHNLDADRKRMLEYYLADSGEIHFVIRNGRTGANPYRGPMIKGSVFTQLPRRGLLGNCIN